MSEIKSYDVKPEIVAAAHIKQADYQALYRRSIEQPEQFWEEQAEQFLDWSQPWHTVLDFDYPKGHIRWFEGGKLNVSVNCLDRHLAQRGEQIAIIWEGDNPGHDQKITYKQLHQQVCKFANVLKAQGVQKGDRVCIYLPMIAEAATVMLACTRIGAVHSVVFGGFSAEALKDRILDADCKVVVCADEGKRGGKTIPLKANVDQALTECPGVDKVIVINNSGNPILKGNSGTNAVQINLLTGTVKVE